MPVVVRVANESDALLEANKRIKLLEQENEVLRRAAAYPVASPSAGKMLYTLVREARRDGIFVAVTSRVLKIARQPYYRWLAKPVTDAELAAAYDDKGRVRHDFSADAPDELWLSDITEHWTRGGKLHVCAIKDLFSNRIVGYTIDSRTMSRLAVTALNHAVARRGDVAGCVLHTDRGSQLRSRKSCTRSPATKWSGPWDASAPPVTTPPWGRPFPAAENVLDRRVWTTREELRIAIVRWIERTYHRRRRQAGLGRLTPVDYELIMSPAATQAA